MAEAHENARLETFCDGVFAIAITLLIIDVGLPAGEEIRTTADLWTGILKMGPQVYAFMLSFIVIFISWLNHHNMLKLLERSSAPFIFANGFLMLTVVLVPIPTNLLGEYILTDHAGPAVVVYNLVIALQALAWLLLGRSAVAGHLCRSQAAERRVVEAARNGIFAMVLYTGLAMLGNWQPQTAAALTTLTWVFWIIYGIVVAEEKA